MENAKLPQFDRSRHGGLFDRGSADHYYHRTLDPHWYPNGSYVGQKVVDLTEEEIAEYMAGFFASKKIGYQKEWDD